MRMTVDEIFNEVQTIFAKYNNVFYDWKELKGSIKKRGKGRAFYIIKKKDCVYIGSYTLIGSTYFNKNSLRLQEKNYVKSDNKYLSIYPHKVLLNKKAFSFKTLSRTLLFQGASGLEPLYKRIYNIDESINLRTFNYNTLLLNEVQNITLDNFIDKLFKDKINDEQKKKLKKLDINGIKTLSLIWNNILDERTKTYIIDGVSIDLERDRIGNAFYIKEIKSSETRTRNNSFDSFGSLDYITSGYKTHIQDYVLSYFDKDSTMFKLANSNDKESLALLETLFKEKFKKLWQ